MAAHGIQSVSAHDETRLRRVAAQLHLRDLTPELGHLDPCVPKAYASDLLSDVLVHAPRGAVWLTSQAHMNVIAVASRVGLAAVVLTGEAEPEAEVLHHAITESIPMFSCGWGTFELAGELYALGVRGAVR